jgi:hypothetical protein
MGRAYEPDQRTCRRAPTPCDYVPVMTGRATLVVGLLGFGGMTEGVQAACCRHWKC